MYIVALPVLGFAAVWRDAARQLASHGVPPSEILWQRGKNTAPLFATRPLPAERQGVTASSRLLVLTQTALCHSDPQAPALCYQALIRHQRDRRALDNPADPLTARLSRLEKSVRRDSHKMHAFVRFREMPQIHGEEVGAKQTDAREKGARRRFGAWFEPDHAILELAAPFFARRFADMDWTIATPQGVARFADGALDYGAAVPRPDLPDDAADSLWATYFTSIFNPARIHLAAMRSEMPLKYWKNLPETRLIPQMLADAEARVAAMHAAAPSQPPAFAARAVARVETPAAGDPASLAEAAAAARHCRRCDLCQPATRTVWGEGDAHAPLMIVGEQPGDHEDLQGRPFVGPAGTLLRQVMSDADVGPVWLTNAVKHFKFTPRGKHRLHQNPTRAEVEHCRWWLDLERKLIAPRLTVALGASAAFALTGSAAPLGPRRGGVEQARDGGPVLVSWHPSFLLRAPADRQQALRAELLADLREAAALLAQMQDEARADAVRPNATHHDPAPPFSARPDPARPPPLAASGLLTDQELAM